MSDTITIKWLDGAWAGFVGDERFRSAGVSDIVDQCETAAGFPVAWRVVNNSLRGGRDTEMRKLSKKDQR